MTSASITTYGESITIGNIATKGDRYDECIRLYGSGLQTAPTGDSGKPIPGSSIKEEEPNNDKGDANQIEFHSPVGVSGSITPADDVDYFRFYVESAGMLEVKLGQVPEEMKARIDLYGKNFNWVTRVDASNPGDEVVLVAAIPGPGQGFLAISDLNRKAHPTDYSFVVDFQPAADDGEPNNQAGDATDLSFDQTITAHICPVDDVDFYKLYVDSAGILVVGLDRVPDDMKTRIDLYNKNMAWVTRKDASNAGDEITMEVDIAGPAAHYIAISDLNRLARADPYTFQVQFRPAPDQNEPNNQVGDSTDIGLGQSVSGYICPVDDVDFYKIYVDAPSILEVKLEAVPESMRARIDLYGKNFNWITRKDASNAGDTITLESDLSGPGSYYIAVSDLDRKAHDQEYDIMAVIRSG
ncbi:MAG TPA: hypothetical protein PLI05_09205 [Methanotrichaceae archaeon]|nr:hypothetical protein [Methanotrichaceae archaeon]HQI91803.1 hypothetical protein [Methanotrichaceae archaeon]